MVKISSDSKMSTVELLKDRAASKRRKEAFTTLIANESEDGNRPRELMEFFNQEIEEPMDTLGLRQLLVSKYSHFLKYGDLSANIDEKLRDLLVSEDRVDTIDILLSRPIRIIGTFVEGRVGGLLFNVRHQDTLEEVIRIKSGGGSERQKVFALVSTVNFTREIVEPALVGGVKLEALAGICFVQMPIIPSVVGRLPPEVVTFEDTGKATVQFFMTPKNSPLEQIVEESLKKDSQALIAGTSANFSNSPSLTNRVHAAVFSLYHGIPYFDHLGHSNKAERGSFSIVRIGHDAQMVIVREGNRSLHYLKSRLYQ